MSEPIGILTELEPTVVHKYTIQVIMEGKRDHFWSLLKGKREGKPSTKSQINLDSIFHYNYELKAEVIEHTTDGSKIITHQEFERSKEGRRILAAIEVDNNNSKLQILMMMLEIKLSRNDTGGDKLT